MDGNKLINSLIAELRCGIELIQQLSDSFYSKKHGEAGSVGEHFRHNLEFGTNLIAGIETGKIDYVNRQRDPLVENDRDYAVEQFEALIDGLRELSLHELNRPVQLRSEVDETLWMDSSVARELEFVHSHTVHHYALISAKLIVLGFELSSEFGVAPSTLRYWNSLKSEKQAA